MPLRHREERRVQLTEFPASEASQQYLAVATTVFDDGYHLDSDAKLAGVISGLQLQPAVVHAPDATSATTSVNATPSAV